MPGPHHGSATPVDTSVSSKQADSEQADPLQSKLDDPAQSEQQPAGQDTSSPATGTESGAETTPPPKNAETKEQSKEKDTSLPAAGTGSGAKTTSPQNAKTQHQLDEEAYRAKLRRLWQLLAWRAYQEARSAKQPLFHLETALDTARQASVLQDYRQKLDLDVTTGALQPTGSGFTLSTGGDFKELYKEPGIYADQNKLTQVRLLVDQKGKISLLNSPELTAVLGRPRDDLRVEEAYGFLCKAYSAGGHSTLEFNFPHLKDIQAAIGLGVHRRIIAMLNAAKQHHLTIRLGGTALQVLGSLPDKERKKINQLLLELEVQQAQFIQDNLAEHPEQLQGSNKAIVLGNALEGFKQCLEAQPLDTDQAKQHIDTLQQALDQVTQDIKAWQQQLTSSMLQPSSPEAKALCELYTQRGDSLKDMLAETKGILDGAEQTVKNLPNYQKTQQAWQTTQQQLAQVNQEINRVQQRAQEPDATPTQHRAPGR